MRLAGLLCANLSASCLRQSCRCLSPAQRLTLCAGAQVDVDELDQNAAVNKAGQILGAYQKATGTKVSDTALQPYDEVRTPPLAVGWARPRTRAVTERSGQAGWLTVTSHYPTPTTRCTLQHGVCCKPCGVGCFVWAYRRFCR